MGVWWLDGDGLEVCPPPCAPYGFPSEYTLSSLRLFVFRPMDSSSSSKASYPLGADGRTELGGEPTLNPPCPGGDPTVGEPYPPLADTRGDRVPLARSSAATSCEQNTTSVSNCPYTH